MAPRKLRKKLMEEISTIEDEKFLKAIELLIDGRKERESQYELTPAQEKELQRRITAIDNGTAKLIPWDEVEKNLLSNRRVRKVK